MLSKAHREQIFVILSSKLSKEDAEQLEKQISVSVLESERDHIKSYINVNNIIINGDNVKQGCIRGEEYCIGIKKVLEVKNNSFKEEIQKINEEIIDILK